jgi:hypothetical protein
MTTIIPTIKLFTRPNDITGTHINSLIFEHQGNNYHLQGRTTDTTHVFTEGLGIYVLTVNKSHGYIGLNSYMSPEPDYLNTICLHNNQEISEYLGNKWEGMKPVTIVKQLINYLY